MKKVVALCLTVFMFGCSKKSAPSPEFLVKNMCFAVLTQGYRSSVALTEKLNKTITESKKKKKPELAPVYMFASKDFQDKMVAVMSKATVAATAYETLEPEIQKVHPLFATKCPQFFSEIVKGCNQKDVDEKALQGCVQTVVKDEKVDLRIKEFVAVAAGYEDYKKRLNAL